MRLNKLQLHSKLKFQGPKRSEKFTKQKGIVFWVKAAEVELRNTQTERDLERMMCMTRI
jgi:hypothetical protein